MQYHVKLIQIATTNPLKYLRNYFAFKSKQKLKKLNLSKSVPLPSPSPSPSPTKKPSRYLLSKQINKI